MNDGNRHVGALTSLISDAIANQPHERGGFLWAAVPQPDICKQLSISPATLRRIISQPPFVRERGQIDGINYTLLRVGEAAEKTPRHIANTMSKMLRDYRRKCRLALTVERDALAARLIGTDADAAHEVRIEKIAHLLAKMPDLTTPAEYGCIHGLVEVWPADHQIEIFRSVLNDWPAYMAGQKIEVWQSDNDRELFFEFASVHVMRKYPQPAVELYVMEKQAKAVALTPELRFLSECIFTPN